MAADENTFSYAAIIDAGSSSSKFFIYKWQSSKRDGQDNPLLIRTAFPASPADQKATHAPGGIQHKQGEMQQYLSPMLVAGQNFLRLQSVTTKVPLYLLATGGMRNADEPTQRAVKLAADAVMKQFQDTYGVGDGGHVRVISGRTEGLFGWVAMNYGKGTEEQISSLLELGGASMQMAFKVPDVQVGMKKVCLLSGQHRVYSQTWDGFGADSITKKMLSWVVADAGGLNGTGIIRHACLPMDQMGVGVDGTKRTIIGSGDFANCMHLMQGVLKEGLKTRDAIPSYLDIASYGQHFYGVSSFWYSYQFFAKWGGYNARHAYDRELFTSAVKKYCTSTWSDIQWKAGDPDREAFVLNRCAHAAWMLTLLHDDQYGFGLEMTQYDTWRGLLRFPTTKNLASRSSWTVGAAALVARHGKLEFCSEEGHNDFQRPGNDSKNISLHNMAAAAQAQSPPYTLTQPMKPNENPFTVAFQNRFAIDMICYMLVLFVGYKIGQRVHRRQNALAEQKEKDGEMA